jgi:hypothetical protein
MTKRFNLGNGHAPIRSTGVAISSIFPEARSVGCMARARQEQDKEQE